MSSYIFLISSLALAAGGPAMLPPWLGKENCCLEKMVGGVEYRFVKEGSTSDYMCLTDCIYERIDIPGSRFCFKAGDLEVICEDEDETSSTETAKCQSSPPIVSWDQGNHSVQYSGSWKAYQEQNGCFASFQGIRFAQPPLGDLRFKVPSPVLFESGGSTIEDVSGTPTIVCPNTWGSGQEDCLFLNIYSPDTMPSEGLPVMVWIYGGSFMSGSGTFGEYGPTYLMESGKFLLVTINYRLGALGFLSLGNEQVPGNAGLLDQVMALQWIQDHIIPFGGDPNRVTIAGESAGSWSTMYHLLSPKAKGLFQRLIAQSGSPSAPGWSYIPAARAVSYGELFAQKVGCPGNLTEETLSCLQGISLETLIENTHFTANSSDVMAPYDENPWNGVIDGSFTSDPYLPANPHELFEKGDFNKDVDVVIGILKDEGLLTTADFIADPSKYEPVANNWEYYGVATLFDKAGFEITEEDVDKAQQILEFYVGSKENFNEDNLNNITDMYTDAYFMYGVDRDVRYMVSHGMTVYQYFFTYKGEHSYITWYGVDNPEDFGVCHGDELYFMFTPIYGENLALNENDTLVKNMMMESWTNFVVDGNPSSPDWDEPWTPVDGSNSTFLAIDGPQPKMCPCPDLDSELNYSNRVSFWRSLFEN